jgi:methylmalonyl-CoA/ethylmalonyl-CoA epimerase
MAEGVGIRGIGQIAVVVGDVQAAKAFHADMLGLRHLFDAAPGMSFFDCGGVRLMLTPPETDADAAPALSILYYDTADIDATYSAMTARGVAFEQPPHQVADLGDRVLWLAFFRDSESNLVALMSEVPKA